jgi:hypothetical protein
MDDVWHFFWRQDLTLRLTVLLAGREKQYKEPPILIFTEIFSGGRYVGTCE